jgi:predicted  nucleic acid-binding Zn-ribbon protein
LLIRGQQEIHEAGLAPPAGAGSFICIDCGHSLFLSPTDEMPECPTCGSDRFRRASLFEQPTLRGFSIGQTTTEPKAWLEGVRESIDKPGRYLAVFADGRSRVIELSDGWSRIGRSRSADIRLDDPTVSRRHAVVVQTPEGDLRVLDDRSMNGISVNAERVDWSSLSDGDELQVGRYTLHVIESAGKAADTA